MERIETAAIQYLELVFTMPRPNRHHNILHKMTDLGMTKAAHEFQGFFTSFGRYVDRVEGLKIAIEANQIKTKNGNPEVLYSEDIW